MSMIKEVIAYRKGILEGLAIIERVYKRGDLNPGCLLELIQRNQKLLNKLEEKQASNYYQEKTPSPLPDPDPSEYVTNRMARPQPVRDTDRIKRVTGEMTTQQPTVKEPVDAKENWYSGFIFGLLTGLFVWFMYDLLLICFNSGNGLR